MSFAVGSMLRGLLLALLALSAGACPCLADVFTDLDVSVASGLAVGKVSNPDRDFTIGGVPFGAMLNRDLSERVTGNLQAQVLLDFVNQQLIRQGFAGTIGYHLLGGARRIATVNDLVLSTSTSRYNLSWLVRGGIFNYAATDKRDISAKLSGGVWEVASGFEYRRTVSEGTALGVSVLTTLITLPTSTDRLTARTTELLGFWRVYL